MGWSQGVIWLEDRKDYNSGKFGAKQIKFAHTSFANVAMLQKVFVLVCGLYIDPLGMIFCIARSYTRMSVYTKSGLIWIKLASTSFTNVQLDQKCKVESSLT